MVKHRNGRKNLAERVFKHDRDVKEEFLKSLKPSTANTVRSILFKVDEYEELIGKSIYDFNLDDRDDFIISMFPNKSKGVINTTRSYLVGYINYCIDNNLVRHMENRFSLISKDDIDNYVNDMAMQMKYLSKEEIKEAQSKLVNNCDKLILQLVPLSARGRTEKDNTNEELINLRVQDAVESYEKGNLKLWNNDGDFRYIKIDDETIELLKKTINDDKYIINNGSEYSRKRHDKKLGRGMGEKSFPLNDTGYVFRTAGKNKRGKVKSNYFNSKINIIKDWVENPFINITNLHASGMIDYVIQLENEKGEELDNNDYIDVCEKYLFGKPRILPNGENDWSMSISKLKTMVKDYINIKS